MCIRDRAMAIKVKETEKEISAFKYYQTHSLSIKPEIRYELDINKFEDISVEVFNRYKTTQGFSHIDKELPDLQAAIDDLLKIVDKRLNTTFEELLSTVDSSQEAVAFFLALLEAVRWGFIKAEQTNINKDIIIEKNYE